MSSTEVTKVEILVAIARIAMVTAASYYSLKFMVNLIDPERKERESESSRAKKTLKRMGLPSKVVDSLTETEMRVATQLVEAADADTTWSDIAGLDDLIKRLKETVILPMQKRDLFRSSRLIQAPSGVLLHGPPGCGKTMVARACAREAGARFINLDTSSILSKWYGESQKLAVALFTLAAKIQPCIIFVDEIDTLLRVRGGNDHEATAMLKGSFMQMWDGLSTNRDSCVIVMGATNRPQTIDPAIMRRMPAVFHVGLPDARQRECIVRKVLSGESVDGDIDFKRLATLTNGFSGSDIKEMCRQASVFRVRDLVSSSSSNETEDDLRTITNQDLFKALGQMVEAKARASGLTIEDFGIE